MQISFHGAAQTVTGSKHVITLNNGKRILLDCGMFQGLGAETEDLNLAFGFSPGEIDLVLLSHAHIDHSGLLPKLVKEGFRGTIFCTQATRDLTELLLYDSAEIQTYETELINSRRRKNNARLFEPLYTPEDVASCMQQFKVVEFNQPTLVSEGVEVNFTHAGHLIGSAAIHITIKEGRKRTRILYSGDIGRYRSTLLQPPAETAKADYIIMEGTYGDKRHDVTFNTIESLHDWIQDVCVKKKGKLVIPAFSVGRTQEVLYALNQLSLEKRLPDILFFIDSPLSKKATETIKKFTGEFNDRLQQVLLVDDDPFDFPGLKYVDTVEESRKLVEYEEPCVIISASGTADAGRVRHHINSCLGHANNAVLFVGYCGAKSLGGQLLSGTKEVEIFNNTCKVAARVGTMPGLSAHGDVDDLVRFISGQDPEKVKGIFIVHGEAEVQKQFAEKLTAKGFQRVECPKQHQQYNLPLPRKRKRIPLAA